MVRIAILSRFIRLRLNELAFSNVTSHRAHTFCKLDFYKTVMLLLVCTIYMHIFLYT